MNSSASDQALVPEGTPIGESVRIAPSAILTHFVTIEAHVEIGAGVIFAGHGPTRTYVRTGCQIAAGAVIGDGIELGRGCQILPGSVVLSSVPPNAIVRGNPAVIIGYTQGMVGGSLDVNSKLQSSPLAQGSANWIEPLGVGAATLRKMRRIADLRGALTVGEVDNDLPFVPRRYFIVFDVPSRELRGEHAHKHCHQFLICVRGSCRVLLDDGMKRREVTLDRPDLGIHMPPLIWGTQYSYSPDAVLLVLASLPYDAGDYIRTYDEFLSAVGEKAA